MLRLALKYPSHGVSRRYGNSKLLAVRFMQSEKPCPEKPAKTQKEKEGRRGTGFFYTVGFVSFAAGATLAYARYDPEFRNWLGKQLPWTDSVIAVIFEEKESWGEGFMKLLRSLQQKTWRAVFGGEYKDSTRKVSKEEVTCDDIKEKTEYVLAGEKKERTVADEDPEDLPETHPKHLVELEKKIGEDAATAISSFEEAVCAIRDYNSAIVNIIDRTVENSDEKAWNHLKLKAERKELLVQDSEERANAAWEKVNKLKEIIQDSSFDAPEALKATAMRNITRVTDEISKAKGLLQAEKEKSAVTDKFWKKVEEARRHYIEELQILFPDFRVGEREWHIAANEIDVFLIYCFQNVLFYQKELAKLQTITDERINSILNSSGETIDKNVLETTVINELEKEKRSLELEFQKRILEIKKETEKDLRLQLRRQAEIHQDQLCDAVAIREKELEREYKRRETEKIASEQDRYKFLLSGMMGRLQGLENSLKARADVDKTAHHSQVLWSACQGLFNALKSGDPSIPWEEQVRPLAAEINALKNATDGDDLVQTVVEGIPKEAVTRGVLPEEALKERFLKVERVAKRIALIPETGAPLPMYALSYLQSLLLLPSVNPIPQAELRDEPTEFSCLDTYDILQRARYWMDRGNIEQTLRYMNLLKGASRVVANDWMNEARILLETRQAANALMIHASAAGLLYL